LGPEQEISSKNVIDSSVSMALTVDFNETAVSDLQRWVEFDRAVQMPDRRFTFTGFRKGRGQVYVISSGAGLQFQSSLKHPDSIMNKAFSQIDHAQAGQNRVIISKRFLDGNQQPPALFQAVWQVIALANGDIGESQIAGFEGSRRSAPSDQPKPWNPIQRTPRVITAWVCCS